MLKTKKITVTLLMFSSLLIWQSEIVNAKSTGWMKTREVKHFMRSLGRSNLLPTKFVCKTRSEGSGPPLVKVTYRKNSKKILWYWAWGNKYREVAKPILKYGYKPISYSKAKGLLGRTTYCGLWHKI